MMHFPLCFRFPPYSRKIFRLCGKFSKCYLSAEKNSRFSSAKISKDLFLVIDHKILISPLFSLFQYISPLFPICFEKFPPSVLEKFTCFLHTLCVFRVPPTLTMMHLCITQCMYWTPLYTIAWQSITMHVQMQYCELICKTITLKRSISHRSFVFLVTASIYSPSSSVRAPIPFPALAATLPTLPIEFFTYSHPLYICLSVSSSLRL